MSCTTLTQSPDVGCKPFVEALLFEAAYSGLRHVYADIFYYILIKRYSQVELKFLKYFPLWSLFRFLINNILA